MFQQNITLTLYRGDDNLREGINAEEAQPASGQHAHVSSYYCNTALQQHNGDWATAAVQYSCVPSSLIVAAYKSAVIIGQLCNSDNSWLQ